MNEEPRARGVSLWLVPEGPPRGRLAGLIEGLAARLGTKPFAPHVTLLPGLPGPEADVLDRARVLAAELGPLTVELSGINGLDAHFRCVFFRVADSRALREAHGRAARSFGREPDPSFDPHLSLVYGTLPPELKAAVQRELSDRVPEPLAVRNLHVWRTEGSVGEWREIGSLPLGRSLAD
jgi:2'-5' RNA ligase